MYLITDTAAISAAFDGAAPRQVSELIREMYPEAIIDKNDRAHAPHDGYVDPYSGNVYRGGEYLPFELTEEEELKRIMSRGVKAPLIQVRTADGQELAFTEGTRGQVKAAREEAKRQEAEFDKTTIQDYTQGERTTRELMLMAIYTEMGYYGEKVTCIYRDGNNHKVVHKGSKLPKVKIGQKVTGKFTVKSTWQGSDGRKATYIQRPAWE